jgi:hypothetical protein
LCARENILGDVDNLFVTPEPIDAQIDCMSCDLATALKVRVASDRNMARHDIDAQKAYAKRLEEKLEEKAARLRESEWAREEMEQWRCEVQNTSKKLFGLLGQATGSVKGNVG